MTREEAIAKLRLCPACRRWITTIECDHCYVDRLPLRPTPAEAIAALDRAIRLGMDAARLRAELSEMLGSLPSTGDTAR